jgi:hypothetical protein
MYCSQTYYKDRKPSPANNIVIYKNSHNQGIVEPRPPLSTIFTSFLNRRRSGPVRNSQGDGSKAKRGWGKRWGDTSGWGVAGKD